ncbi:MAG: YebC/PmpR family DNA-binding transcriptional regulator [Bacteroidota bacterium]|nr:YebC/PmpR family DNA-binding transcriptional regulator [Bacteroidota bacterium]
MAGHSKWANIKHRKGAQDAKRSKIFTRIIKELTIATKEGGEEIEGNPRLKTAIQNAKGANMPKDTIQRAIEKGGRSNTINYTDVSFEGYGSNGVAIFVECTTDNNNRTVANIRAIFNKYGGTLGTNGSLEFIFERKGVFIVTKDSISLDIEEFEMELIDCGLEELQKEKTIVFIYTDFANFSNMQKKLEELNVTIESAKLERIPNNTKKLNLESAKSILKMIDAFDDDEDVQNIFHNLEMTDELMSILNPK